ncbi:MAG: 30S ribosomal protein S6 [Maricaulaceae bacterium]|jgi:small subunit ribosomal protein S6
MPLYEHTFIARQDISPQQVDALVEDVKTLLKEHGGDVKKYEYWGLKNLAYRINKNRKGHYAHLGVEAPAPAMHEVERRLKLHEDVLRHLTIRVDDIPEGPSPILAKREERKRRDRDRDGDGGGRDGGGRDGGRGGRDRDKENDE